MKKIIFIFLMLICAVSLNAQKYDYVPFISGNSVFENQWKTWEFSEIVQVDSTISQEQLFMTALEFIVDRIWLPSKDFSVTVSDKESGKIYGKGCFSTNREGSGGNFEKVYEIDGIVCFVINIQCKDGRFKYTFNEYFHKDAWVVNTFGQKVYNSTQFNYGSFLNEEPIIGGGLTGRSKKCWISIKNEFKRKTYFLIEDLKKEMSKKSINKEESW